MPSDRADQRREQQQRTDRAARQVAALFVLAGLFAVALFVVYATGGHTQLEGLLLFGAFGALGTGIGLWVRRIVGPQEVVEERAPLRSRENERAAFRTELEESLGEASGGGRRRFLATLGIGSAGAVGLSLLLPLRSLGPGPENELFETPWAPGKRLVDEEGGFLRPEDVGTDQVVTVFPEDAPGSADGQALVIGMRAERFDRDRLPAETIDNTVCYSKICTHAGCPVGLYRARAGELLCPCHQSTFDVSHGATVVSGPAARALPQLPLGVDDEGYLIALGEFTEPVGPSFWNLDDDPGTDARGDG